MSGIVISYRREDAEGSAGRLYDRLVSRYGADFVFMDYYSIEPGQDWRRRIEDRVAASNVVLAVIGTRWLSVTNAAGGRRLDDEGDNVRHEIRMALEHDVRLLPILVGSGRMVTRTDLPDDLAGLADVQAFALTSRDYDRDAERLYRLIDETVAYGGDIPGFEDHRTAVAGFVGRASKGPAAEPVMVARWSQFEALFGDGAPASPLGHAVHGWFLNGGEDCVVVRIEALDGLADGLIALEAADPVTIVAAPDIAVQTNDLETLRCRQLALVNHCERMHGRLAILDPPPGFGPQQMLNWVHSTEAHTRLAAVYYPWLRVAGPDGRGVPVPPSGHVAGTWARNDRERGVWAPPANLALQGVAGLERTLLRDQAFVLQRAAVNTIRSELGRGIRVWGARTLSSRPADQPIATVRLTAALGALVRQVTGWAAFERPAPRTWNRLRSGVEAALEPLWRRGAFAGGTPADAFYVRCDEEVNVPELSDAGRIRVEFGFAPTRPGEFVQMYVEQPSGDIGVYAG